MRHLYAILLVILGLLYLSLSVVFANAKLDWATAMAVAASAACCIALFKPSKPQINQPQPLFAFSRTKQGAKDSALIYDWARHEQIRVVAVRNLWGGYNTIEDSSVKWVDDQSRRRPALWLCITSSGTILELEPAEQRTLSAYVAAGWFEIV